MKELKTNLDASYWNTRYLENDFAWDLGGSDDIHATARYRREMVRRLGKKIIREALDAIAS